MCIFLQVNETTSPAKFMLRSSTANCINGQLFVVRLIAEYTISRNRRKVSSDDLSTISFFAIATDKEMIASVVY